MALIELLHFFLLGCIVHLSLDTLPHLRQRVLVHRKVPASECKILWVGWNVVGGGVGWGGVGWGSASRCCTLLLGMCNVQVCSVLCATRAQKLPTLQMEHNAQKMSNGIKGDRPTDHAFQSSNTSCRLKQPQRMSLLKPSSVQSH